MSVVVVRLHCITIPRYFICWLAGVALLVSKINKSCSDTCFFPIVSELLSLEYLLFFGLSPPILGYYRYHQVADYSPYCYLSKHFYARIGRIKGQRKDERKNNATSVGW